MPEKRPAQTTYNRLKELYIRTDRSTKDHSAGEHLKQRIEEQILKLQKRRKAEDQYDFKFIKLKEMQEKRRREELVIESARRQIAKALFSLRRPENVLKLFEQAAKRLEKYYPDFETKHKPRIYEFLYAFVDNQTKHMARQLNHFFGNYRQKEVTTKEITVANFVIDLFEQYMYTTHGSAESFHLSPMYNDSARLARFYSNPFIHLARRAITKLRAGSTKELEHFVFLWASFCKNGKSFTKEEMLLKVRALRDQLLVKGTVAGVYSEDLKAQGIFDPTGGQVIAHELVHQLYHEIGTKPPSTHSGCFILEARTESLATLIYVYALGQESKFRGRLDLSVDMTHPNSNLSLAMAKGNGYNEYELGYHSAIDFCESVKYDKEKIKERIFLEFKKLFDYKN
ncbi:MAG: hypothetical protein PHH82_00565 [Candidatus ainarchaeum sp.]|nr:hypothetical protein [Candidatus ainarchaeum sp.]